MTSQVSVSHTCTHARTHTHTPMVKPPLAIKHFPEDFFKAVNMITAVRFAILRRDQ